MISDINVNNIHKNRVTIRANVGFIIINNEIIMNTIPNTAKLLVFFIIIPYINHQSFSEQHHIIVLIIFSSHHNTMQILIHF